MDVSIKNVFIEALTEELLEVVISNSSDKEIAVKIKIRPITIKGALYFQVSEFVGEKVLHRNDSREEIILKLPTWFDGLFRQVEIKTMTGLVTILISKKGKATINHKAVKNPPDYAENINGSGPDPDRYQHDRIKKYILEEGNVLPFLVDLGVMTDEGRVIKAMSDKFRQINRFLEFIEDILPNLDKSRELTILDFGCGKSYLTFVMYYYLKIRKGYDINVVGLDLKADVIKHCNELSIKYGYEKLHFLQGDIASFDGTGSVDMVVTLHACDTATDYALYKAVSWGAQVILSVPCCQHELNGQLHCEMLQPLLKYGIIRERMASLITDALRADILESAGYRVQLLEFINMEHTPKNILIRAVKRGDTDSRSEVKEIKRNECMEFLGVSPCLARLLGGQEAEERD